MIAADKTVKEYKVGFCTLWDVFCLDGGTGGNKRMHADILQFVGSVYNRLLADRTNAGQQQSASVG